MPRTDKTVLVVGAGDFLGTAIARRFAREGFHAVGTRRRGDLEAFAAAIEADGGRATGIHSDARDEAQVTALVERIEAEIGAIEAFVFNVGGKHALRALAQSLARELGPLGMHVAHVVIDGPIDTQWTRELFPDWFAARPPDGVMQPQDIAEIYWHLHTQPRAAWTFETDVRPYVEPW